MRRLGTPAHFNDFVLWLWVPAFAGTTPLIYSTASRKRSYACPASLDSMPGSIPILRKARAYLSSTSSPNTSSGSASQCSQPDRKSTRLNSSHVKISYAVFCLKKKKKKNNMFFFYKKKHKQHKT